MVDVLLQNKLPYVKKVVYLLK